MQHRISLLFVSWEKTLSISYKHSGQVGFAAGQVDFQVTCLAGRVAVQIIIEAWHIKLSKSYRKELNICILEK